MHLHKLAHCIYATGRCNVELVLLCQGIRQPILIHVHEPEGMVNRMADGKRDMITLVYATHPSVSHSKVRILREILTNQVNHIWASLIRRNEHRMRIDDFRAVPRVGSAHSSPENI
jgi:hypothetical protein